MAPPRRPSASPGEKSEAYDRAELLEVGRGGPRVGQIHECVGLRGGHTAPPLISRQPPGIDGFESSSHRNAVQ